MTNTSDEIISNTLDFLPALPATVAHVLAVTTNPESDANDLMRAILPDQAMCAAILKIANSAFLGLPKEVSSIERAVVVLGHTEIRNIVIGRAIFNAFPQLNKNGKHDVGLFWEHTFNCGLLAMIIGRTLRENTGEFFIAGLIHDIGRLPLLLAYSDKYMPVQEFNNPYSREIEVEAFGISHEDVGIRLAKKWLFPEQLVATVGYHHRPAEAPNLKLYPFIIDLASNLAQLHDSGTNSGEEILQAVSAKIPETLRELAKLQVTISLQGLEAWLAELAERREKDRVILDILTN